MKTQYYADCKTVFCTEWNNITIGEGYLIIGTRYKAINDVDNSQILLVGCNDFSIVIFIARPKCQLSVNVNVVNLMMV